MRSRCCEIPGNNFTRNKKVSWKPTGLEKIIWQFHAKSVVNTKDDDKLMNHLQQITHWEENRVRCNKEYRPGLRNDPGVIFER